MYRINTYKLFYKHTYIMNGSLPISGKPYRDECPCNVKLVSGVIEIRCICADKDIYPDPIEDSFTYDEKSKILTSTRFRNASTKKYINWKQEN